jgi:type I restriction enzyme S subunit
MSSSNTVRLGDIADKITKGTTPTTYGKDFVDRGINFIKIEAITEEGSFKRDKIVFIDKDTHENLLKRSQIQKGDILLTMAGAIGRVALIDDDWLVPANTNQAVCVIRVTNKDWNIHFLKYFLKSPFAKNQITGGTVQTAQPNISLSQISSIQIPEVDIEKQNKIAKILGDLDRKIELNRRMNETLEQIGRTLFRHYFIDNPESESWNIGTFSDIAEITTGRGSVKSQESTDGKIPLYGANGVMGTSKDYLYNEKLIITGRVGTLGKVKIVNEKAWFSDNVLIIKPNSKFFYYCYYNLKQVDFQSINRGSTQPLITQTDLRNLKIKVPERKVLEQFEEILGCLLSRVLMNDREIVMLSAQRDILLPRLMLGEIGV